MPIAYPHAPPERRLTGLGLTLLAHVALLVGWQAVRQAPSAVTETAPRYVQWLRLPVKEPVTAVAPRQAPRSPQTGRSGRPVPAAISAATVAAAVQGPGAEAVPAAEAAPSSGAAAPSVPGASVLQRALRDAGAVDKALRKETRPYIVAPLDSPQIRLRNGIGAAADLAPNKWYEAPKVAELVNNTGDGARRTRVITSGGTYCVTERATNTRIDMIEKHGKLRITNCPEHETPASAQGWRTAPD